MLPFPGRATLFLSRGNDVLFESFILMLALTFQGHLKKPKWFCTIDYIVGIDVTERYSQFFGVRCSILCFLHATF